MEKKNKKKYEILSDQLIELIKKNNLKQNDRLPTVREMIKNWNFSYATVHRTLIEMENKGLITRRQGKGMYVNKLEVNPKEKQVALMIPSHFSAHKIFIDILKGVRTVLEKKRINLLISISNMSHEKEKVTIERLLSQHVDGIIIFLEDHYRQDFSHVAKLIESNFPFILVDRYIPELETDYVVVNNTVAMHKICSYLKYNKGCDKIVFVPDSEAPTDISSSEEKTAGFKEAVKILYGSDDGTIMDMDELVSKLEEISRSYKNIGISMNHDGMIIELLNHLQSKNCALPPNCHVFGYNNSFETPLYPTVEQFNDKVGMKAAEILIEKMANANTEKVQVRIEPKLLIPDSNGNFFIED